MAEAESTLATEPKQPNGAGEDIESRVKIAMAARAPYFQEQADSLTFEGVRRVLEKDLGLETHALDAHKKFVKKCLAESLESFNNEVVKSSEEPAANGEKAKSVETNKGEKGTKSGSGDVMEDSPVMGLMTGLEKSKKETKAIEPEDASNSTAPSEDVIKRTIEKRASHLRENSENITMAGVRRLLEEDLKLDMHTLDPFKKFISAQVNEVMAQPTVSKPGNNDKKINSKRSKTNKQSKADSSSSSKSASEEDKEVEEVKPRKRTAVRSKPQIHEGLKKRKKSDEDTKAGKKQKKESKKKTEENSEAEDTRDVSEDETSDLSAERPTKLQKKEVQVQKPTYGKRVEHLKSVIKACGMSIPPTIYRKAKQAPENQQESTLIKELEGILAKEGLGPDPSEKEIKEVKKKKDRARELEGIDMSNIVSSSRRRSTARYAPPEPKLPVESDSGSGESDEEDDDDDDDDDEEVMEQEDVEDGNDSKNDEDEDADAGDSDSD